MTVAPQARTAARWPTEAQNRLQDRLNALLARQRLPYRAVLVEMAPGMMAVQLWDGPFKVATQHAETWLRDMGV